MTCAIEPKVRSTAVGDMSPQNKLFAAISILQAYILAEDSLIYPDKVFGINHMPSPSLEMVERLLQDLIPALDFEHGSDKA